MTTAYPGALDNFAEASPTYMSDPDATGRVHSARHDDVEAAVEQIEETLGVNPQGPNATVAERLTGQQYFGGNAIQDAAAHYFRNLAGATFATVSVNGIQNSVGAIYDEGRRVPTHYWDETVGRRLFVWDTNNSRWQMVYGDTGWRDISSLLVNGWTGYVWLRRINNYGYFQFSALNPAAATATRCIDFPNGFGPPVLATHHALYCSAHTAGAETSGTGVNILNTPTPSAANVYGHISYPIDGAWPTSLPGTALGAVPQGAGGPDPGTDEWRNAVHDDIDPAIPTGLTDADDVSGWTVDYPEGPTP